MQYLPSHCGPLNPSGQLQIYESSLIEHVPLCSQGLLWHGVTGNFNTY